jgi:hypothetical protein
MNPSKRVEALEHIRKLRGGSQPVLVKASDDYMYVVKFQNSLQGPNLLFNEAVGTEVFRSTDLLVPEWRIVHVSDSFISGNPECWFETESGIQRPKAGLCFGSRLLSLSHGSIFEILAGGYFSRVRNRSSFWTARVLDLICDHADNRQALFLEGATRWLDAYFIDHGHLFGGAEGWAFPQSRMSKYLDARIYTEASQNTADEVIEAIEGIDLKRLDHVVSSLPAVWKSKLAMARFGRFRQRIADRVLLRRAIHFLFGMAEKEKKDHEQFLAQCARGSEHTNLRAQVLPPRVKDRVRGRKSDIDCGEERRGSQTVCPA